MSVELKPCPFCGGEATWGYDEVQCVTCDTIGPFARTKEGAIDAWNRRIAALPQPITEEKPRTWRCFHCDEVFTDAKLAAEHFGASEHDEAGCKMLAKGEVEFLRDYRDLSARWMRCVGEDCDASRLYHVMGAEKAKAVREAEESGYAKGLADGRQEQPITAETVRRVLSAHNTEKHADPGFYSDNTTMTYREFCEAIAQRANQQEK